MQILSDLASDGDIAFTPPSSFTVTTGPSSVLFGIDSLNINLPEFRAFLTFPLDGNTGQPVVPGDAFIVRADVEVFVNLLDFASTVPTFLDLVQYPFRGLAAIDFDAVPLATRPVFDFFASDQGFFVPIDVTSLMQAAQVPPALVDFQLRFSRDMSVPPLAPSSPSAEDVGRTVVTSAARDGGYCAAAARDGEAALADGNGSAAPVTLLRGSARGIQRFLL